jgi:hypothetical protein
VDVKDELKNTSIQITCLDEDGNVLKRVTSGDNGDIEDDSLTPDPSPNGEGSENQGGGTQNGGGTNTGGNTGGNSGSGPDDNGYDPELGDGN